MPDDIGQGEFRSTGEPQPGVITGRTFKGKAVRYSEIGGLAILEGDIAIGRARELAEKRRLPMGAVVSGKDSLWRDGLVPYQIDRGLPAPRRVLDAMAHWQSHTPVRFVERTTTNANQYRDYINFEDQGACWSFVGRQGGRQSLSLGPACAVGNAIHEIGHALGLWHEQSREDRDRFVHIRFENIIPGREHNFDQHITDGDDVGDYDFASIMHYPGDAFSKNGQPTIEVPEGVVIGQRDKLSDGDVAAIRALYA